jgi:peptidoglycan hydrolase FlgJ
MTVNNISLENIKPLNNANNSEIVRKNSLDDNFEEKLKKAVNKNDENELKIVCKQFEAIMLGILYKQMKATIIKSELIPKSAGNEIFESMMDDELMSEAAQRGGTGLSDTIYEQLSSRSGIKFR